VADYQADFGSSRVENVDVKNKSGRNEHAFPVQGTCWEKSLKENIIFGRLRRRSELLAEGAKPEELHVTREQ
jgi:hypothetical protein